MKKLWSPFGDGFESIGEADTIIPSLAKRLHSFISSFRTKPPKHKASGVLCFYMSRISTAMPPFSNTVIKAQVSVRPTPAVPGLTTFTPPISWESASWVWP